MPAQDCTRMFLRNLSPLTQETRPPATLHRCLPEYFCMPRFNPCVFLYNTLSQIFEKHPRGGGLGTYVQRLYGQRMCTSTLNKKDAKMVERDVAKRVVVGA